ncbi:MAG TPA: DNA primase [Planctomycetota bacterium]|nr:DNA primase [Planctomycetota bacterium]
MAYISQQTILDVKRACDIYEVVSHYIPLKRAGSNYKALCPFHEEKTPSFNINVQRQIYKCFGCGKGGGVVQFVMELEKVEFHDAIKLLAERAGIPIRYEGPTGGERSRDTSLETLRWAVRFYHDQLLASRPDHPARQFLAKKRISDDTLRLFQLGLAPDGWDGLLKASRAAGIAERALEETGLLVRNEEGRVYDRFRDRVMIPVPDAANRIITFGGRALADDQKAKYINGPETPLFQKGRTLFGIHLLKGRGAEEPVTVVEGYFDVIVPHQKGVTGIVATLGTALTREHLTVLRRYTSRVALLFDADEAGRRASDRAWEMLFGHVMDAVVDLRVCELPPGKDPDEMEADALRGIIDNRREVVDLAIQALSHRFDPTSSAGRVALIDTLLDTISAAGRPTADATFRRDQILSRVSERFQTDLADLKHRVSKLRRAERSSEPTVERKIRRGPEELLVRELLAVLMAAPELVAEAKAAVPIDEIPLDEARAVLKKLFETADQDQAIDASDLVALFNDQPACRAFVLEAVDMLEEEPAGGAEPRVRLSQCLQAFGRLRQKDLRKRLREQYKASGDDTVAQALQQALIQKKSMNREDR